MISRALQPRSILPEAVAVLGLVGQMVICTASGHFRGLNAAAGRVLVADETGRELYVLAPRAGDAPVRPTYQAMRAANLHERFMHRRADKLFNCIVPAFRAPVLVGELVILRYEAAKRIPGADGAVDWEHYFENPGVEPAYPRIFAVGHGQYWVPPGPFKVAPEGITFAKERNPS